jgi:hypothetical protein
MQCEMNERNEKPKFLSFFDTPSIHSLYFSFNLDL